MAYISGTAATDIELYQTLIAFLTTNQDLVDAGQNWELLGRQSVPSGNTVSDFISLRGPGFAGEDNIYVHLEHYQYALTDTFSIRAVGSVGWLPSALTTPGQQPDNTMTNKNWSGNVILRTPLQRNPMQYWIVANGRRFVVVLSYGNRWTGLYAGLLLPFGFPAQYPYPLLIGAGNHSTDSYQNPPVGSYIYSPVTSHVGGMLHTPGGAWVGGPRGVGMGLGRYTCWPWDRGDAWQEATLRKFVPVEVDGVANYGVLPIHLISRIDTGAKAKYGTLDGVGAFSAFNAEAGDIVTMADNSQHLVYQLETNNDNAYHFALKLE